MYIYIYTLVYIYMYIYTRLGGRRQIPLGGAGGVCAPACGGTQQRRQGPTCSVCVCWGGGWSAASRFVDLFRSFLINLLYYVYILYIYVYTYEFIYKYIHTYMYIHNIYIYIYIYVYIHIYIYIYIDIYV